MHHFLPSDCYILPELQRPLGLKKSSLLKKTLLFHSILNVRRLSNRLLLNVKIIHTSFALKWWRYCAFQWDYVFFHKSIYGIPLGLVFFHCSFRCCCFVFGFDFSDNIMQWPHCKGLLVRYGSRNGTPGKS